MANRRPLTEGLKPGSSVDPKREEEFVYGDAKAASPEIIDRPVKKIAVSTKESDTRESDTRAILAAARSPITARYRIDLAVALKRASLERQMAGIEPYTRQDILEEALEYWLRSNDYMK